MVDDALPSVGRIRVGVKGKPLGVRPLIVASIDDAASGIADITATAASNGCSWNMTRNGNGSSGAGMKTCPPAPGTIAVRVTDHAGNVAVATRAVVIGDAS